MDAAFRTIGLWNPEKVRIAWISNTKDLEFLAVSPALMAESGSGVETCGDYESFELPYDDAGNLPHLREFLRTAGSAKKEAKHVKP
jgi:hypothetical protein